MDRQLDITDLQAQAVRPFEVLESLDLPAHYERSFKMRPGALRAQRYLLGVPTAGVSGTRLIEAARRLGMPEHLQPGFAHSLEGASMVLYGFEGGDDGTVFKAYTEHRARLALALAALGEGGAWPAPVELFRGFKWREVGRLATRGALLDEVDAASMGSAPVSGVQTVYRALPGLRMQQVLAEVKARLRDVRVAPLRVAVLDLLDLVQRARPDFAPVWLDVGELDEPVRAFDLNLYDAGLRVQDIAVELRMLAQALRIERDLVRRLLAAAGPGLLGHVCAGCGRDGLPCLTIYFEPAGQA
jgi:hypothetical protein